jgi:hypothetical protein
MLASVKVDGRRLVLTADIEKYFASLRSASSTSEAREALKEQADASTDLRRTADIEKYFASLRSATSTSEAREALDEPADGNTNP